MWCLEYLKTVGFHFGSQMGQTDPIEGRRTLHGACRFDSKEGKNKLNEIREGAIAQLVLDLLSPKHCPSSSFKIY